MFIFLCDSLGLRGKKLMVFAVYKGFSAYLESGERERKDVMLPRRCTKKVGNSCAYITTSRVYRHFGGRAAL